MQSFVLLIWLALCAAQDVQQRHIANSLTLGAGLLALIYLLWTGTTWLGAPAAQGGWALLLALLFTVPGYVLGRLGAADVKLMATIGLATDNLHLLGSFIGAGVASLLWLLIAPKVWPHMSQGLRGRLQYLAPELSKKAPFAPFVLIGVLLTLPWIH
ncbi:prepilin peptidase [Pseudomonas sp. NPDC087697]|uniref:prepilin peptidase n=1 Tax=Pseudomonas sp. NPDC087697 TaxID=3364447 RepID=UPI00381B1ED9